MPPCPEIWHGALSGYHAGVNASPTSNERTGLNFWQWIGLILLVVGLAVYIWNNTRSGEPAPGDQPAPPAQPADPTADPAAEQPVGVDE